ncbi:MAG: ABC-2 type transporter-domain-containing protein [Monoraphidium minutum]|nr:MAG: ABC-2 type transporter-domain-containing protein [Monoraphidium minutum]
MAARAQPRAGADAGPYVTFAWLFGLADPAAGPRGGGGGGGGVLGALLPRALGRARPPGGAGRVARWHVLLAAAALSANAVALAYLARRAWLGWGEGEAATAAAAAAAAARRQEQIEAERRAAGEAEAEAAGGDEECDSNSADEEEEEAAREGAGAALAYLQRLWEAAAGRAPADLGEPDERGVYTYVGRGGAEIYFRRAPLGGGGGGGGWQWSTGRRLWLPTAAADSVWSQGSDSGSEHGSNDGSEHSGGGGGGDPGLVGRLLIRRLELESLLATAGAAAAAAAAAARRELRSSAGGGGGGGVDVSIEVPPLELAALFAGGRPAGGGASSGPPTPGDGGGGGGTGLTPRGLAGVCGAAAALMAEVPDSFLCPLCQRVMTDPVVTPSGVTYDRGALRDWIARKGTDPATGHALAAAQLYSNLNLRDQIAGFFIARRQRPGRDAKAAGGGGGAAASAAGGGGGGGEEGQDVGSRRDCGPAATAGNPNLPHARPVWTLTHTSYVTVVILTITVLVDPSYSGVTAATINDGMERYHMGTIYGPGAYRPRGALTPPPPHAPVAQPTPAASASPPRARAAPQPGARAEGRVAAAGAPPAGDHLECGFQLHECALFDTGAGGDSGAGSGGAGAPQQEQEDQQLRYHQHHQQLATQQLRALLRPQGTQHAAEPGGRWQLERVREEESGGEEGGPLGEERQQQQLMGEEEWQQQRRLQQEEQQQLDAQALMAWYRQKAEDDSPPPLPQPPQQEQEQEQQPASQGGQWQWQEAGGGKPWQQAGKPAPGPQWSGVDITLMDLDFSVGSGARRRQLLTGVTCHFESGRLTAVMGPGDDCKSALLDLLAGRRGVHAADQGRLRFAGAALAPAALRRCAAFVERRDALPPGLSVEEALALSAELRRPPGGARAAARADAQELLVTLGLVDCRAARIGGGPWPDGISGGAARRLSIGAALAGRPRILVLDEPASGLDGSEANEIAALLKSLACGGLTVVAAMAAPTPYAFGIFDSLLVLLGGQPAYFGPGGGPALDYALRCPAGAPLEGGDPYYACLSDAEWLADLYASAARGGRGGALAAAYRASRLHAGAVSRITQLEAWPRGAPPAAARGATIIPWWRGLLALLRHRTVASYASPPYLAARLWDKTAAGLMVTWLFWGAGGALGQDSVLTPAAALFVWCTAAAFGAAALVPSLMREHRLFQRERRDALYRPATYLAARALDEAAIGAVGSLAASAAVFWGIRLRGAFAAFWLAHFAAQCAGGTAAHLAAALAPSAGAAGMALSTYLGSLALACGFLVRFQDMPAAWRWYSRANPLAYSFTALMQNQFGSAEPPFPGGQALLQRFGIDGPPMWSNVGASFGFSGLFLLLTWIALLIRRH